jgi:hypothetical protein
MDYTNNDEVSNWTPETVFQFVKENILQLLLLLLVFVIIYAVDHITNINTMLYAVPMSNTILQQKPGTSKKKSKK